MSSAAAKDRRSKADTMSASMATKATAQAIDLTPNEEKVVRQFVVQGRAIDKPVRRFLALGIKAKAIFASKTRGVPVIFEGKSYLTFDDFVEKNFPRSGRTMRRWLSKEGKTDTRFANKPRHKLAQKLPTTPAADTADWTDNAYVRTCVAFIQTTLRPLESDPQRFHRVVVAIANEILSDMGAQNSATCSPSRWQRVNE